MSKKKIKKIWQVYLIYFVIFSFAGFLIEYLFGIAQGRTTIPYDKIIYQFFGMKSIFIPFYGAGAVILIFLENFFRKRKIKFALRGFLDGIIIIIIEFLGGLGGIFLFGEQFWNYSGQAFNFLGIISLKMSFFWILTGYLFSIVYSKFIDKTIRQSF